MSNYMNLKKKPYTFTVNITSSVYKMLIEINFKCVLLISINNFSSIIMEYG